MQRDAQLKLTITTLIVCAVAIAIVGDAAWTSTVDFSSRLGLVRKAESKEVAARYHLRSRTPDFFSRSKTSGQRSTR